MPSSCNPITWFPNFDASPMRLTGPFLNLELRGISNWRDWPDQSTEFVKPFRTRLCHRLFALVRPVDIIDKSNWNSMLFTMGEVGSPASLIGQPFGYWLCHQSVMLVRLIHTKWDDLSEFSNWCPKTEFDISNWFQSEISNWFQLDPLGNF